MGSAELTIGSARLPRTAVIVLACLLLGFAVGALLSSAAIARRAPRVTDVDFAVMVADLYEHERSVFNARERLGLLGRDPVDVAEAALESYGFQPTGAVVAGSQLQRDQESLGQLVGALRQAEIEAGGGRSSAGPGTIALLALIVASVALAAGGAWIWKKVEMRGLRLPQMRANGRSLGAELGRFGFGTGRRPATVMAAPASPPPLDDMPKAPAAHRRRTNGRTIAGVSGRTATLTRVPVASTPARFTFDARYELGDDPYDEIFPIHDAEGELIGACGVSATEPADRRGRYYGFTVWLQDYGEARDMAALGLVTRSGMTTRGAAIAEWRRRGTIDQVETIERGTRAELGTERIDARLSVMDFDYSPPAHGSPGYFGALTLRLEVQVADS